MAGETTNLGKVTVAAKVENLGDLIEVERGLRDREDVRSTDVTDALVDTGATCFAMPRKLIDQLGLKQFTTRRARTVVGVREFAIHGSVQLTVQGRTCRVDVDEVAEGCPVIIGQVPLELLDWLVDPVGQRLIGNPDHGGEQMIEMF